MSPAEPPPIAIARLCIDADYLARKYDDWARHVSRWRRYELRVALGVLAFGLLATAAGGAPYTWAIVATGALDTVATATARARFLRNVRRSHGDGTRAELRFTADAIHLRTPDSASTFSWAHFRDHTVTPTGLFLGRKGATIYIPDVALEPASAKSEIVARLSRSDRAPTLPELP